MKTVDTPWRCVAALAWLMTTVPVLAQQECKLPAEKRLKVTSTVVWECGFGTGDPGCNHVPVLVTGTGSSCKAQLPYGTLKVYTRGRSSHVTWELANPSGFYTFDTTRGIDIASPAPYYDTPCRGSNHTPCRGNQKWKFHWRTSGKANPSGTLHHCPVVFQGATLCAAEDPVVINIE